ncbi:hypothetical protein M406DRAFT_347430 [Cryphonectria parasitica EP155]|uniref:Uncharacterized protein n=1 Tax=Cryphonectria parasitica (strain ATCC 38755 / EP155) TaxID=660469 RepID=A0A9P4XVX6_CRYP1|nr:uncharacterized protein M406DRAFT_347430 [Cryphonectria parasitica EP155]KAF3762277.1 hypothetical protein M406DRAFT_347430 [Cryphonectria parasitica EP155]
MSLVVLILGAGPRIGASVAETFASNGYKVAIASRKGTGAKTAEGYLSIQADFTNPESIPAVFDTVKAAFSAAPSVVVYNAPALTPPPDSNSIFSIPAARFESDLKVNTVSAYVAAQQAVIGWETLSKDIKKTFIYTGNIQNVAILPVPLLVDLGVGKSASAYWLGVADATSAAKGYRFFYADERTADGKIKGQQLDGPAHGEFYIQLANHQENVPWQATFVKGKGYVKI